ncbi:MAG: hypothetical protein KME42_17750 [Tildeniella nuda ZEHNDER 1965/U140]|jgi:hypothetical protein|nr:hypothetical protein [Tildeniella nuda ZEHNDER 1965/U140]
MADPQEPLKPLLGLYEELEGILASLESRLSRDDLKNVPEIQKALGDLKTIQKRAEEAKRNYKKINPQLPPRNKN